MAVDQGDSQVITFYSDVVYTLISKQVMLAIVYRVSNTVVHFVFTNLCKVR